MRRAVGTSDEVAVTLSVAMLPAVAHANVVASVPPVIALDALTAWAVANVAGSLRATAGLTSPSRIWTSAPSVHSTAKKSLLLNALFGVRDKSTTSRSVGTPFTSGFSRTVTALLRAHVDGAARLTHSLPVWSW